MKVRDNILSIIFTFLMIGSIVVGTIRFCMFQNEQEKMRLELVTKCEETNEKADPERWQQFCEEISTPEETQFFDAVSSIEEFMPLPIVGFITILAIVACACYYPCRYLKSGILSYELSRRSFKDIKKKIFAKSRIPVLIIFLSLLVINVISYILAGNFGCNNSCVLEVSSLNRLPIFFLVEALMALLLVFTYTNLSLIVSRKQHNYFLSVIITFLTIIGIELFFEIFIGDLLCWRLFGLDFGVLFNILDYVNFTDSYGLLPPLLVAFSVALITEIFVIIMYKDKEALVVDSLANE